MMDVVLGIGVSALLVAIYTYILVGMIRWYKNFPKE
jgi:hypothetical protein